MPAGGVAAHRELEKLSRNLAASPTWNGSDAIFVIDTKKEHSR